MIRKLFILLLIIFSYNSCDILRDSKFDVISWTPGEGYHSEPEEIIVSLIFSHVPDTATVERRFSLNGENGRIRGIFLWEGKKMTFIPLTPLEINSEYYLSLSSEASNTKGLSMDMAFERNLTTRAGNDRPVLISCYPAMYEEINNTRTEVQLGFSLPVTLNTLYDNVSFNPSISGFWRLEDDGRLAVYTPGEPWVQNKRYEIRISASLTDNKGMYTRNDFTSIFTTGTDHQKPVLLHASRITKTGDILLLNPDTSGFVSAAIELIENCDWEKEDLLSLVFSKPVDGLSVNNFLSIEGASSLIMKTYPGYETEFIFCFEAIPVYESRFLFRLKPGVKDIDGNESSDEYIYRIFANGKFSKPPSLAGIRMPMAPGNEANPALAVFSIDSVFKNIPIADGDDNYPSGEIISTWIELYFITAENASIDIFSVMDLFRVETSNNVLSFSPRQIKTENFSIPEPYAGWKDYQRLEITGNLTNSTNFGIVNFLISPGLKDNMNNINENLMRISVIK